MKPVDEVVQRDDHLGGNLVTAIERTPSDLDTCRLEFVAKSLCDFEREDRIRAPVREKNRKTASLSKMLFPFPFVDERGRKEDQGRQPHVGSKRHLAGNHGALRKSPENHRPPRNGFSIS